MLCSSTSVVVRFDGFCAQSQRRLGIAATHLTFKAATLSSISRKSRGNNVVLRSTRLRFVQSGSKDVTH